MERKSKVPYELKILSVEKYIKGNKSASQLARTLGISVEQFRIWVLKYNVSGAEGLKTHSKNKYDSLEVKHSAVNDYISGKGSLYDICSKYNISSHSVLQGWILKYNNSHNKWKSHNTKENKIMTKCRKTTYNERVEIVAFCIENNDNYQLTSNKYKVSYQQVYTWVRKYKENGYESLRDNRGKRKNIDQMSETEKLNAQIRLLEAKNKQLEMEIKTIACEIIKVYKEVQGIYGYRRIKMNINRNLNTKYNHKRIYRLMKSLNLKSVIRKKRKNYVKSTPQITAENILNRDFSAATTNEKWLTDLTEFKLTNGTKAYLSTIIDLYDNSIVSYVVGHSNNNKLVFDTLDIAVANNPTAKPIFHSDRGYQYTSKNFKAKLDKISATQSMSYVGRCIDNGPIEWFWELLNLKCII